MQPGPKNTAVFFPNNRIRSGAVGEDNMVGNKCRRWLRTGPAGVPTHQPGDHR